MQYRMHFPALNTEMIKYECTVMQKLKKRRLLNLMCRLSVKKRGRKRDTFRKESLYVSLPFTTVQRTGLGKPQFFLKCPPLELSGHRNLFFLSGCKWILTAKKWTKRAKYCNKPIRKLQLYNII